MYHSLVGPSDTLFKVMKMGQICWAQMMGDEGIADRVREN
jgi:hypothetical protein